MKVQLSVFVSFFKKNQRCKNVIVVAFFLGMTVLIFSCNEKVKSDIPSDMLISKKIPSLEATDFQSNYTDSGVVRYFLTTPKMLVFDKEKLPYKEFPDGFHIQQFDENKKIISELSANYGKNFQSEQKWLATGNVVMVNNKGDTLRTEELIFLEKENKIYSDKFVSIKKGDQDINGSGGFESDTQMTKWIFKKTAGHMYFEEK
jgi:LPS export ABC transporter protein LptC